MKKITIYLLLLCWSPCFSQSEYLIPSNFKSQTSALDDYYNNLRPLLHSNFKNSIVQYTKIPSFAIEEAFSCQKNGNKKVIVSNTLSKSYWYTKNKNEVELRSQSKEISDELFMLIDSLFKIVSDQIQPVENDLLGNDGVIYHFEIFQKSGESKIGQTWSPRQDSPMGKLVGISEKLYSLGNGMKISQNQLKDEIKLLIKELKK